MVPNVSQNHIKLFMALCEEFVTKVILLENAMCRKSLEDWKWNKNFQTCLQNYEEKEGQKI